MRLWSLHPSFLDRAGLTACWREGLLARKVLEGNTVGYRFHPQLVRFRKTGDPLRFIDAYLHCICDEAAARGYNFDRSKLGVVHDMPKLKVTAGQVEYEFEHLLHKLSRRDKERYDAICAAGKGSILPHPLFEITGGPVEKWEIIK